jgi:hypothetical protein
MGRFAPTPRIVETRNIGTYGPVPARAGANDAVGNASLRPWPLGKTAFDWGENSHRTAGKKDKPL